MIERKSAATLRSFHERLRKGARIYVAGCSGEPLALARMYQEQPDLCDGLTFLGIWIPGVNGTDWTGFHEKTRAESIFVTPALRKSFQRGATAFRPLSYTQAASWLCETKIDAAIVMVSRPLAQSPDRVSYGVSADFSDLVLQRTDIPALALINEAMPAPGEGITIPLSRFHEAITIDEPLVDVPPAILPPVFRTIGNTIAQLIDDGNSLQFGLGNVQQAVLTSLGDHRRLRLHSGMVSDPVLSLLDAGSVDDREGAVTTGVAIGTRVLYDRAATDPRFRFRPVPYTHAVKTLRAIERFKAINSAIEVDLFGQVNAEFINGRQVSGTGGLVDFLRGAALSPGGRGIIALASTARNGMVSRIVPRLPPDAVSIARADVETVVTEHGVATLRHKSLDERAESLIAIADPQFKDQLAEDWRRMRMEM